MFWFSVVAGGAMLWLAASIWALGALGRREAGEFVESTGNEPLAVRVLSSPETSALSRS
jgi:hypothetical protein